MLVSMTGFGRAEVSKDYLNYTIEIKSVNSRFFELSTRLPRSLFQYEADLKSLIKKRIERGKVLLVIQESRESRMKSGFSIDEDSMSAIVDGLRSAAVKASLRDDLALSHIIPLIDMLQPDDPEGLQKLRFELVMKGIDLALKEYFKMASSEGENLEKDLEKRLDRIDYFADQIRSRSKLNLENMLSKLRQRIESYLSGDNFDMGRLEQEVVLLVDKADITEEIVRLKSHIDIFRSSLKQKVNVGKKLNFILQEMNREVNTMASKSSCAEVSRWVVESKEELEKMREQVQNIA